MQGRRGVETGGVVAAGSVSSPGGRTTDFREDGRLALDVANKMGSI